VPLQARVIALGDCGVRGQTARRTCGKPEPGETWPHYVGVPLLMLALAVAAYYGWRLWQMLVV